MLQDVDIRNAEGNTPLHWACLNGCHTVAKILLDNGANPATLNGCDADDTFVCILKIMHLSSFVDSLVSAVIPTLQLMSYSANPIKMTC